MQVLVSAGIVLLTIAGMELFSWTIHKYLFHGPLWFIHKSHHQVNHSWFELNDIFSLSFALGAIWLIIAGLELLDFRFWIGTGISLYGLIYFVFHDGFIHQRFKTSKFGGTYLKAIRKAHKIHHKNMARSDSKEFGLLVVSPKYFKNLNAKASARQTQLPNK